MPKKIKFESFVYRFLAAAETAHGRMAPADLERWNNFVAGLNFHYDDGSAIVSWNGAASDGGLVFPLQGADFFHRGDSEKYVAKQREQSLVQASDRIQQKNADYFGAALHSVAEKAGVETLLPRNATDTTHDARLRNEEAFHDQWASLEDAGDIDVLRANEVCTSPEMRFIRDQLGELAGKKLLDVGCGLGEASTYFALKGAQVTAMDLSQGMLDATVRLAERNGVNVQTHKAAAEDTRLAPGELFDVIYAGNLLHHVDIAATLKLLKPHLAPGGVFISWDPVAYNPVINAYRAIATDVRTPDEHPLKLKDIQLFRREFGQVTTRYFWLTTLVIFVVMALVQRRSPNKERFWKVVVNEGERWAPIYKPLAKLDDLLLAVLPPLRLLCWNVVIVARNPA